MKKILTVVFITVSVIILSSLGSCKPKAKNNVVDTTITTNFDEEDFFARIDQSKVTQINAIVEGFASPVEMAAMIKDNHIQFKKEYMLSTKIVDDYETNIKKALGLGLLSADLGYLNIYKKTGQMIDYLVSINSIAGDLRVAQFFDFQTLKTLVTQSDNMDTLLFMTVSSFHQIDAYFTQSNRSYLTVLSVTGVWIESLYLLTQVANDNPDKDFIDKIGSQKELLTQLVEIEKVYKGHPQFDFIIEQLEKLQQAFSTITIETVQTQGHVDFVDGNYVIYPSEETTIDMPDGTLETIISTTKEVRNAIVNIK